MVLLCSLAVGGCGSEKFVQEQSELMINKGRPILEEYVSSLHQDGRITKISMINGCNKGEPSFSSKYPSHIVEASFLVEDNSYTAVVDLENDEIYSDYEYKDPNDIIQKQLKRYCDRYGFRGTYKVSGAFYSYAFLSSQVEIEKGVFKDTYTYIDYMNKLAPVGCGDELKNASLSGFNIEYESMEDECFNPQILYDYLSDTGNYRKESIRGDDGEYIIRGGKNIDNYVNLKPAYYEIHMTSGGDTETMSCDVRRWDCMKEDVFCYVYVGGEKNESIQAISEAEYTEYRCPFILEGDELTYLRDDNNPYEAYLYLDNPKWNIISRTCYVLKNVSNGEKTHNQIDKWELVPSETEELEVVKCKAGEYYELYEKGTDKKCDFIDDKVVINFTTN